jgi:multidrug efflux pump subunit AcrA (membrane-fusion protein)
MPDERTVASIAAREQLEHAVEQLHAAARSGMAPQQFYEKLFEHARKCLRIDGAAVWSTPVGEEPSLLFETGAGGDSASREDAARRRRRVAEVAAAGRISADAPPSPPHNDAHRGGAAILAPVAERGRQRERPRGEESDSPAVAACLELRLSSPAPDPDRQRTQLEFAAALAEVAADYHAFDALRRRSRPLERRAIELLARLQRSLSVDAAAGEIAQHGRALLEVDRVMVLVRRGGHWRLVAVSGVDSSAVQRDFSLGVERLAQRVASWGEPIECQSHAAAGADQRDEETWPDELAAALHRHLDLSQARELACVPAAFSHNVHDPGEASSPAAAATSRRPQQFDAMLIAERFHAVRDRPLRESVVELAELCRGTLERVTRWDRFPHSLLTRWAERRTRAESRPWLRRLTPWTAAAAVAAALALTPCPLVIEAPATLHAGVEREVFATATGSVARVEVEHGQAVDKGALLVVLRDPELELQREQVLGELAVVRKRLAALAVARTDRTAAEPAASDDGLPLSAEEQQWREREANLLRQSELLDKRRQELEIRSPVAGVVLTREVHSLLASRPVERGQSLLTVADVSAGWELIAEVPQRRLGRLLDAQADGQSPPVTFRLAGDVAGRHEGRVSQVEAVAALDAVGLLDDAPPVRVHVATVGPPPAEARPGMSARVRIECGRRSLGYVWLSDAAATLYRWATF